MEPEITDDARRSWATEQRTAKRAGRLVAGEQPFFIGLTQNYADSTDTFYLTTERLIAFNMTRIVHSVAYESIASFEQHAKSGFSIRTTAGRRIDLLRLPLVESAALRAALEVFPRNGKSSASWRQWVERRREVEAQLVAETAQRDEAQRRAVADRERQEAEKSADQARMKARAEANEWPESRIPLSSPNSATAFSILQNCRPGEEPWLILSRPVNGSLIAFDDRLLIIKKGFFQGLMAGALGGQRCTTFYYRDITAIEYNSGILNGVLEVLTASYQGTANKDFWRGSNRSRNADSNDPFTLSNTLPLDKPDHNRCTRELNELRERISLAKSGAPMMMASPPASPTSEPDLVEQLARLGRLRADGVLTDEEFAAAKNRLLGAQDRRA